MPPGQGDEKTIEQAKAGSFDREAQSYDRFRLGYPDTLFDAMAETAELGRGAKVLEIGCGTGKATVSLAERGYAVTAIEPGGDLIAVAEEKLRRHPNVTFIESGFEDADLPAESFNLAVAAMSLHWVDKDVRFKKPHDVLKPGGSLAILYNWPLAGEASDHFYQALQAVAQRHGFPEDSFHPVKEEQLGINPPIDTSLFEAPEFFVSWRDIAYESGSDYAGFLATLSQVSVLPEEVRQRFLEDVERLIEDEFGNRLELPFASTLALARKKQ